MIPVLAYAAAGAFAAGLALGGWIGADWIGGKQRSKGYAEGLATAQQTCARELLTVQTEMARQGLATQMEASKRANEIQRLQQAAIASARVEFVNAAADSAADLRRVTDRLRLAQAAAARANRSNRMSPGPGPPAGDDPAAAPWVLHARAGEDLVRLAARADAVSAQYRLCHAYSNQVSPP